MSPARKTLEQGWYAKIERAAPLILRCVLAFDLACSKQGHSFFCSKLRPIPPTRILLPREDAHVDEDLTRIRKGKDLAPVLLVRGDMLQGVPLVVADGYHRICAICLTSVRG